MKEIKEFEKAMKEAIDRELALTPPDKVLEVCLEMTDEGLKLNFTRVPRDA